jgi:ATP synthase protein I
MQPSDARTLRGAAIPTGLAGLAAILAGLAVAGGKGALGAALGSIIVIAFFSVSVFAVSYASKISPQAMFGAAVFSYVIKIFAMLLLIAVFKDATAFDSVAFGYAVIALTLVWVLAEVRTALVTKTLYIDEPAPGKAATAKGREPERAGEVETATDRGP